MVSSILMSITITRKSTMNEMGDVLTDVVLMDAVLTDVIFTRVDG